MSFPQKVAEEALSRCGRCCCICHKFCGTKMELHHIKQKAYGGEDTLDNCIPLCFDCHSDMGKADPNHSKGKHYSEEELRLHRDSWFSRAEAILPHSPEKRIRKEDVELFETICKTFTPDIIYWLKDAELSGSHPYDVFDPLYTFLRNRDDPFSEFLNFEMEKLRGNLLDTLQTFLSFLGANTFGRLTGDNSIQVTRLWMLTNEDFTPRSMTYDEAYSQYHEEAQTLNSLATAVWRVYQEFVRQGRRILSQ